MFNMPVKEYILVFSVESDINAEDIINNVSQYIKLLEQELSLHPPSNVIYKEKGKTLRDLYEWGYEEEEVADRLGLGLSTVGMLIKEGIHC